MLSNVLQYTPDMVTVLLQANDVDEDIIQIDYDELV